MIHLLHYPTGYGKTKQSIRFSRKISDAKKPLSINVVVQAKAMIQHWKQELSSLKLRSNITINILSINELAKEIVPCDIYVFDEIHKYTSSKQLASVKAAILCCKEVILLTATPNPNQLKQFGAIDKHVITNEKAIKEHKQAKHVETAISCELSDLERLGYNQATAKIDKVLEMYSVFKKNNQFPVLKRDSFFDFMYEFKGYPELYKVTPNNTIVESVWNYIAQLNGLKGSVYNGIRNQFVYALAWIKWRRELLENNSNKINSAIDLLKTIEGRTIVFCGNAKVANTISTALNKQGRVALITSKVKSFNYTPHRVDSADYIVTIRKLNTGYNDVSLQNVVILDYNWTPVMTIQQKGRALRYVKGKVANIYKLYVKDTIEELKYYKTIEQ